MGCMRVPHVKDEHGNKIIQREEAIKMIRYAADHGVTYFDSARMYFNGDCDALLGEALAGGYREKVKVVSKILRVLSTVKRNSTTRWMTC